MKKKIFDMSVSDEVELEILRVYLNREYRYIPCAIENCKELIFYDDDCTCITTKGMSKFEQGEQLFTSGSDDFPSDWTTRGLICRECCQDAAPDNAWICPRHCIVTTQGKAFCPKCSGFDQDLVSCDPMWMSKAHKKQKTKDE